MGKKGSLQPAIDSIFMHFQTVSSSWETSAKHGGVYELRIKVIIKRERVKYTFKGKTYYRQEPCQK